MIRNPILRKEVLSALRTRKAVVMQGLFLLVAAVLAWTLWPSGGLQDIRGDQAQKLFGILALGQLVMVALFAPAFTAAAITGEMERNTFESLFATAMRPSEIAVGKMVGSLAFLLIIVLSGAAAMACPFLLGGVSPGQVFAAIGVLILTTVYLGMIGLLVSTRMHRSYRAIIVTYAILLVLCFFAPMPVWPISNHLIRRVGPGLQAVMHAIASLSPVQAMLSVIWPDSEYVSYGPGEQALPAFWRLFCVLSLLVIAVTAALCLWKLRRPIAPPRPREKLKVVERRTITARNFFFLIDPRKRKRMIAWWQNPVLIKEFRTRPMLQAHWLLRAIVVCVIVSILLMFLVSISVQTFAGESADTVPAMVRAVAALMTALILLIGPAVASGTICADRESGVWDLMRATRLASWRVVSGKFQASIIPLLLLGAAMTPAFVILLIFYKGLLSNVLATLSVVAMTVLFVATLGTFFSSLFSRTSTATAWTYSVVICLGLLSLLMLLNRAQFSQRLVSAVLVLNPVAAAMAAAGSPDLQAMGLPGPHLKIFGVATAVLFVITVARVFQLRQADS